MADEEVIPELTPKQKKFCEEYLVDLHATKAAIRAGYSKKTAYSIGSENLKKPELKKYISDKLGEQTLTKSETVKLLSDLAQSSLNDYFKIKKRVEVPRVKVGLQELIDRLEGEMDDADEFIRRAGISNAEEIEAHNDMQEHRRREVIKLQIKLEKSPGAYVIEKGPERLIEVAELDLPKLVKDKKRGRIKSLTPTEFGMKVELYPADAALRDMAKIHGAYEPAKVEIGGPDGKAFEITLNLK